MIMTNTDPIRARDQIKKEDTWAIEDIFPSDRAWWDAFAQAKGYVDQVAAFRGRLGESGAVLLDFFRLNDALALR